MDDQAALWDAIAAGDLDTVASDDFTIPRAAKLSGPVVDNVPGGHNGIETRMDVLYSEGVASGRLPIQRYVRLTAESPAKLFGLYPRKGTIAVGSDADLAVIDPQAQETLTLDRLHSACDYSLWDGWKLTGKVRATVLRGSVLVRDGAWVGPERIGRFVPGTAPRSGRALTGVRCGRSAGQRAGSGARRRCHRRPPAWRAVPVRAVPAGPAAGAATILADEATFES